MFNSQEVSNRIKKTAKSKGIALKEMLSECDLGINLISHLAKGQAVTYVNIAKIADYLDCSVDYLLGRTENPESHKN
jgi:transcriptional regulator with XRE-family HTH domain